VAHSTADVLAEARAAQRAELAHLAETMTRVFALGPGVLLCVLYLVQALVRGYWQLWALAGTSFAMWIGWWWARWLATRGRIEPAALVILASSWVHCTATLCLRAGGFGAVSLAAIGCIVVVWLLAPRRLVSACVAIAGQLVGTRVLDYAGMLPLAPTTPAAQISMDVAMSLALVPLIAIVLRRGTRALELPFRRLEETAGSHLRLLGTVEKLQPELRALAAHVNESASGVAASATELSMTAQELSRVTYELQGLLTSSAAATTQARAVADATRRSSAESGEALGDVERELERFLEAMTTLARSVTTLSERSAGAENVIDAVEDVHQNVKVLAINAALEAARAGEAGRGIHVVATELRAMIAGTEASVKQGRAILGAVRGEAVATVDRAEAATQDLQQHVASLRRSRALIADIIASFGETAGAIDTIATAGEDQKRRVERVSSAMLEMQRSAEGLSRAASELLGGAERVARTQAELGALFEKGRAA
jgi:methyl-accepting chemotaxis protein